MTCRVLTTKKRIKILILSVLLIASFLLGARVLAAAGWRTGKFSSAYDFAGAWYTDAGDVYNGVKTISFWMQGTANGIVVDLNGSAYIYATSTGISTTGFTSPTIYVDGTTGSTIDSNWHFIVITTGTGINASAVKFGSTAPSTFSGTLDEVKMYNRVLSAREIAELYRERAPSLAQGGTLDGNLYVMNGGSLGVSTTSPNALLSVYGTTTTGGELFRVATSTQEYFVVDGTGTVGVGTSTPTYRLETLGTSTAGFFGVSQNSAGDLFAIDNQGYIGIGTSSPVYKLDIVDGSNPQLGLINNGAAAATTTFEVDSNGDLTITPSGDTITIPDDNLKVCSGGACPTTGYTITGNGNLVVESKVVADKFEQICPAGYIWVPGSAKHGTLPGFCVMKYEARSNAGVPYSTDPTVVPWVSISQETSRAECLSLGEGYHLISEAEWLTIAENIAVTEINDIDTTAGLQLATGMTDDESWYESNATMAVTSTVAADPVTTGCNLDLSLEHADNAYATSSCEVRGDNANGNYSDAAKGFQATDQAWNGTYTSGGSNDAQLRTHVLSNGNVIWDLSGNVWEWVDELLNEQDNPTDGSEAGDGSGEWEDWNTTYNLIGPIANSRPPDDGWTSSNGIGKIYTWGQDETGTTLYALRRGGYWGNTSDAGVFTLSLADTPTYTGTNFGFRCVR